MSTNNADKPAFARSDNPQAYAQIGLTKREYFAAAALQGLCVDRFGMDKESVARIAVQIADATLAELERAAI